MKFSSFVRGIAHDASEFSVAFILTAVVFVTAPIWIIPYWIIPYLIKRRKK